MFLDTCASSSAQSNWGHPCGFGEPAQGDELHRSRITFGSKYRGPVLADSNNSTPAVKRHPNLPSTTNAPFVVCLLTVQVHGSAVWTFISICDASANDGHQGTSDEMKPDHACRSVMLFAGERKRETVSTCVCAFLSRVRD